VIETIEVDGRPGIVFERCDATSMLEHLLASPDTWPQFADRLASLHAAVHTRPGAGLPRQRERLHDAVVRADALSQSARQAVLARLARREDGGSLCHGDFNPAQVVGSEAAPVILDWFDATCGDPAADVATTLIALRHAALPATLGARDHVALDAVRHAFAERYLSGYRTRRRLDDDAMHAWLPIAAAARLSRRTGQTERAALLDIVGEFLKEG
jgi:aminoglycoside phosphotransferase (APT) family kinase protein